MLYFNDEIKITIHVLPKKCMKCTLIRYTAVCWIMKRVYLELSVNGIYIVIRVIFMHCGFANAFPNNNNNKKRLISKDPLP